MKFGKKMLLLSAVLLVAVGVLVLVIVRNLDSIVRAAIERYGSQAVGTSVDVDAVRIELSRGIATIKGLTVANPPGFQSRHAFSLGSIAVRIEPRTAVSPVIVINEIRISAPQVVYERSSTGTANLDVLKKNLDRQSGPQKPKEQNKPGADRRLRIVRLIIEKGSMEVRGVGDRPLNAGLSRIELKDIGGAAGATPDQAAKQIMSAVLNQAGKRAVESGGKKLLEKGMERLQDRLQRK